jgi:hypothetical protein
MVLILRCTCCYFNSDFEVVSSLAAEQNMKEEYPFSPPKVKYVSRSSHVLYSDNPIIFSSFVQFSCRVEDTQKGEFLLCMLYLVRI